MPFSLLKALFADKPKAPEYGHRVWSSHEGKWKGLITQLQPHLSAGKPLLLLAWFPKTLQNLEYLLTEMGISYTKDLADALQSKLTVALADDYLEHTSTQWPTHTEVWLVEHYPLHALELAVLEKVKLELPTATPIILASLDEELFAAFGGDRIKEIMLKLGGNRDEVIEHSMVKASVVRAQQKVAEGIITEMKTQNDEEWFLRNYKKPL